MTAPEALAATSTEGLLDAMIRLTHSIHSYDMREGGTPKDRDTRESKCTDLRAQRDLVRAEVLRRAGA